MGRTSSNPFLSRAVSPRSGRAGESHGAFACTPPPCGEQLRASPLRPACPSCDTWMTRLRPSRSKAASVYSTDQAGYRYRIEGGKACILFADSSSKDLAVPEAIDGAPVTAIAAGAFSDLVDLEHVSLPDSLTSLGAEAFARCTSLRAAKLGCALESIGEGTFRGCRTSSASTCRSR